MTLLDNIVEVKLSKSSGGLIPRSFNSLLILGYSEGKIRCKTYDELGELAKDYDTTTPEFKAAQLAFGQSTRLDKVTIGQVFEGESFEQAYRIIAEKYPDFYAVMITSKEEQDQLMISSLIETENRIFGISCNDEEVLNDQSTSDILHKLKTKGTKRTFVIYSSSARDGIFPEAAWFGLMLTKEAGSATWAYKVLTGFAPDMLARSKTDILNSKNGNYFCSFGGRDVMFNGKMTNGEFIDIITGLDWLTMDLQTRVGNALISAEKIPFTNTGITIIQQAIFCSLTDAATRDIVDKESIKITVPNVLTMSIADREKRNLTGVKIEARLVGAIHQLKIRAIISN